MTQKFYLRNLTAANPPTAGEKSTALVASQADNATGTEETRSLDAAIGVTQGNIPQTTDATTSARLGYHGRFTSKPLQAGTYGSGTWTMAMVISESAAQSNFFLAFSLYFWRPSNNTVVGFVYDVDATVGSEPPTSETGEVNDITGANVTIQDGDVLVLEVWRKQTQAMATAYTNAVWFGGATEPTDGVGTSDAASYILAPADIPEVPAITPQLVTDSISITQSPRVGKSIPITQSFSNGESIIRDKNFVMSQAFAGSNLILLSKGTIIPDGISTTDKIIKSAGHIIPLSIIAAVGIFKGLNLIISQSSSFVDLIKREKHITLQDAFINSELLIMSKNILVPDSVTSGQSIIAGKSILISNVISISDFLKSGINAVLQDSMSLLQNQIIGKSIVLSNSISLAETILRIKAKDVTDGISVIETQLIGKTIRISDSLNNAENIAIEKFLKVLDSIIIAESFLFQKTLLVSNGVVIAENVLANKVLTLLDSIVISSQSLVGKSFVIADSLSITSNIIRNKLLNLQDTVTYSSVLNLIKSFTIPATASISESLITLKNLIIPNGINTNRILSSPIQDISNAGGWVDSENGNNNGILYDELDETVPDDDVSAISLLKVPAITDTFEVKLATITNPSQNSGIKIKIRGRGDGDTKVRAILLDGTTVIAITPWHPLSIAYDSFEYELTEAEASSITDYTNLRIRLEPEILL